MIITKRKQKKRSKEGDKFLIFSVFKTEPCKLQEKNEGKPRKAKKDEFSSFSDFFLQPPGRGGGSLFGEPAPSGRGGQAPPAAHGGLFGNEAPVFDLFGEPAAPPPGRGGQAPASAPGLFGENVAAPAPARGGPPVFSFNPV